MNKRMKKMTSGDQNFGVESRGMAQQCRAELCLNGEWDFCSEADGQWTRIQVPGAYAGPRQSWGGAQWDVFDYPEVWAGKGAVYRRTFVVPPEWEGLDVRFAARACAHHTEFFVNGHKVGEWHDGYTPIEFSLNTALKPGENLLEARVSDRPNDLFDDYGTHRRGFWQDTFLKARPWTAVGNDLFVKTSVAHNKITCEMPVENAGVAEADFRIECIVTERDGTPVKRFGDDTVQRVASGAREVFTVAAAWSDPRLWSPHDPHLYDLHVRLLDEQGTVLDHTRVRFGFREITWRGPHLYLNGHELFLRGHGGHYLGDIQGSRAYMEAWLGGLLERGVNFMRLHDSPKHHELYEVADEKGMLLEAEAVCHFRVPEDPAIWEGHLERLIKAQRNHPSIFTWSVSNELRWRGGGEKPEMIAHARRFDPTRPVFASDFSLESRHGDICAHHYDPVTVFEDWERFGPDKPMLWDELGSVWDQDRPLSNGTSGFEAQAQDYATGLWHDGHDRILRDILMHHEGKVFNGELHRVNGFIPWDLSYNFFRWQPTNNNQRLEFKHDDLGGPGIKPKHVRPVASPVNPWDPTLPVFEPNPGFALFAKFMRPVRFFDDCDERTFFSGSDWTCRSRIFYDDLRPADELVCRVETLDGDVLTETGQALDLVSGRIAADIVCRFEFPAVACITPVRRVRLFRYQGAPGYRETHDVKIFPRLQLPTLRLGALEGVDPAVFERAGLTVTRFENAIGDCDVLLADPASLERADVRAWLAAGGKALCLAGSEAGQDAVSRIADDFTGAAGVLSPDQGLTSASGCVWHGWTPVGEIRMDRPKVFRSGPGGVKRIEFSGVREPGSYVFACFERPLAYITEGGLRLTYHVELRDVTDYALGADRILHRRIGLLLRDAGGRWFLSGEPGAFPLSRDGEVSIAITHLDWEEVTSLRAGLPYGRLETQPGNPPDFSVITGAGLYQYQTPPEGLPFLISKIEWQGRAKPAPLIPFNGAPHRLLADMDQQDLSFWREGAARCTLDLPDHGNVRVVLAGNKDGMGAALYERLLGSGLALVTSLKLDDLEREPAANGMLANSLAYLAAYRADRETQTAVCVEPALEARLEAVGLLRSAALDTADILIVDGPNLQAALEARADERVRDGATLLVCGIEKPHLEALRRLTGRDLALTEPYLGERRHCIKAAVSWTKRDTPPVPVEYYDKVIIPQPFEPNYDPLIAGWVNRDLHWDGCDMFRQGIELRGMDPVRASADYAILVSNWRIDWRKPNWGGEYTHAPKDQKRADWFVNRDPVLLKLRHGKGTVVLCQLDWLVPGDKPRRVLRELLTNLSCALDAPTRFAPEEATFDFRPRIEQLARFAAHDRFVPPARRLYYGIPAHRRDEGDPADIPERAPTLMLGDLLAVRICPYLTHHLWQTHAVTGLAESLGNTRQALEAVRNLATRDYSIIYFGFGLEDLRLGPDGRPAIGIEEFKANLTQMLDHLKSTGAKLYWTTILPLPRGAREYQAGAEVPYNAAAQEIMDAHGVYTCDIHSHVVSDMKEVVNGEHLDLKPSQWSEIAQKVSQAIEFFGAQQ
jgi:hypothetical protein